MKAEKVIEILSVVMRCIGFVKKIIGKIAGKEKPKDKDVGDDAK